MDFIKRALVIVLIGLGCSGCELVHSAQDAMRGGPRINDNVFMGRNGGERDAYEDIPGVIPLACRGYEFEGKDNGGLLDIDDNSAVTEHEAILIERHIDSLSGDDLVKCVDAMKLLIDTRWAHFEHVINGSVATTNFFADAAVTGLAASIPLVASGTKSVLGAITAGISGTRKNFDEDILYSYSIQNILQQMRTDRSAKAADIDKRLHGDPRPYRNMSEAASDLFEYDQAGGWEHAMASLQTHVAAQTADCVARLRNEKMGPTAKVTEKKEAATATEPCPAH